MRSTPWVPGMLGAHIEKHKIGVIPRATHAPVFGTETQRLLLGQFLVSGGN